MKSTRGISARRSRRCWPRVGNGNTFICPRRWRTSAPCKRNSTCCWSKARVGLLSPLGENFDSGDLIAALGALPLVVAQNRLGAINHILLTLEALPRRAAARARVVLMSPSKRDVSTGANAKLLAGFFDARRIFTLPWLGEHFSAAEVLKNPRVRRTLRARWRRRDSIFRRFVRRPVLRSAAEGGRVGEEEGLPERLVVLIKLQSLPDNSDVIGHVVSGGEFEGIRLRSAGRS